MFYLKQYDKTLLSFDIYDDNLEGQKCRIEEVNPEYAYLLPIGMKQTNESLWSWLRGRIIPKNREYVDALLAKSGLSHSDTRGILRVCRGLSLNDSYWVIEDGVDGLYADYNLYDHDFVKVLSLIAYTGYGTSKARGFSSSPEFTTAGMLRKGWRRMNGKILLYKGGTSGAANAGNEPYSEYYAAQVAEQMGLRHVNYDLAHWKKCLCSTCELFTDIDHSYVPIHRFVENYRLRTVSDYLKKLGKDYYDEFVDMLVFDALIYNEDRHFGNFGLIVDNKTNKPCGFAPLFDHGLSLFNYAMPDEVIDNLDEYAKTRSSAYGVPFENVVKEFVTARQKEQLRRMIGFSFKPHRRYNPPVARFRKIGEHLQKRTRALLEIPSK